MPLLARENPAGGQFYSSGRNIRPLKKQQEIKKKLRTFGGDCQLETESTNLFYFIGCLPFIMTIPGFRGCHEMNTGNERIR